MIQDVAPSSRRPRKPKRIEPPKQPDRTALLAEAEKEEAVLLPEPVFKTPDEIAAEEASAALSSEKQTTSSSNRPVRPLVRSGHRWLPHNRRQWIAVCSIAIVLIAGAGSAWALTTRKHTPPPKKTVTAKVVPAAVPTYSDLSGLPITDPSLNKRPVTAVMVENSTDARPQSGLSQAGVVFEAQAEGGITRFMALYQDTAPTNVGPIRSSRPYYVQWALGFNAAYAHVGGSPDALSDITKWGVQDMNQFYNGGSYHRISSRPAPHNVYTGIDTLNQLESSKGYTSTFTGFPRADKAAPMSQPTASTISLNVSGPVYNPEFTYNATTNSYDRSTDGTPDTDANTGKQLSPTVVVAIVLPLTRGALDASGAYYSNYNVLGSGTAYVFQNGGVAVGQWHKNDNASQITFSDASGKATPLNRGQTWVTAVTATSQVAYHGASPTTTK